MIKSIKVMLLPNDKQNTKMFQCSNISRFAYNWAISREQENYKSVGKFISDNDLRKEFTKLKSQDEFQWLCVISNNVSKQAIKDACNAYKRFFKHQCNIPKFKTKKNSKPSFYVDPLNIRVTSTHVKLEKISSSMKKNKSKLNLIKLSESNIIPLNCKYYNPRITFDGLNWWISIGIETQNNLPILKNNGIGIDLGIKELAICSDGAIYKNINKKRTIKQLKKRQQRLQHKISRKYLKNKKGESYCKTSNIIKSERKLLKLNRRLINIRHNYLHQTTTEIVNRKPMFIVLENLNVKGMMKNKHLSKAIQEQNFYEFKRQMKYKCEWNGIKFIEANRFYPSSKLCSSCGHINKNLKLSDRIYICPECGNKIDRDYQASLNLKRYGENVLQSTI